MRKKNSQVAALITHANYLSKLSQVVQALLPMPLSEHVYVANFQQHILTLVTDNPVWASRLRYSIPELRHKLKSHASFPGKIDEIVVKVSPDFKPLDKSSTSRGSTRTVDSASISTLAEHVDDSNLKQALLRLASHTQKIK